MGGGEQPDMIISKCGFLAFIPIGSKKKKPRTCTERFGRSNRTAVVTQTHLQRSHGIQVLEKELQLRHGHRGVLPRRAATRQQEAHEIIALVQGAQCSSVSSKTNNVNVSNKKKKKKSGTYSAV